MRSLEEILAELNAAEKEYESKCREYGIEESPKRKRSENNIQNSQEDK